MLILFLFITASLTYSLTHHLLHLEAQSIRLISDAKVIIVLF